MTEITHPPHVAIRREHRPGVLAWLRLARVHTRVTRAEYTLLAEFDLTPAQFDVLARLAAGDGLSQQALADRMLVTKGNICGLVDRLQAAGLVERRPHPADRRSNQILLTPAGLRAYQAAAPALEATVAAQMSPLTGQEQAALMALLARLDRALRRQP